MNNPPPTNDKAEAQRKHIFDSRRTAAKIGYDYNKPHREKP